MCETQSSYNIDNTQEVVVPSFCRGARALIVSNAILSSNEMCISLLYGRVFPPLLRDGEREKRSMVLFTSVAGA